MFLVLVICSAFLHVSRATELIKTIKRKRFHGNLQPEDFRELSNLITNSEIDKIEGGCEYTALRYASSKAFTGQNSKLICELLLSKGANVNARDSSQCTPLMQAAYEGNEELVRLLLLAGANPFLKNKARHTALDRANGKGDHSKGIETSSMFFGVMYSKTRCKWCVQRRSKMQQKTLYNKAYDSEGVAALASDTLVRSMIADGEQGLTYTINFRAPGEWIEHVFDPNCAAMLESCNKGTGWRILNINPNKFLKNPLNRLFARALISEFLGNKFVLYQK